MGWLGHGRAMARPDKKLINVQNLTTLANPTKACTNKTSQMPKVGRGSAPVCTWDDRFSRDPVRRESVWRASPDFANDRREPEAELPSEEEQRARGNYQEHFGSPSRSGERNLLPF